MSEYLGEVLIPEITPSGTFPITSDYGHGLHFEPEVVVHRFGSGNAKIEQRFYLGNGARRFTVRKSRMREADRVALKNFWENQYGPYGAFTYNAPNDDGVSTTAYTCRFADEPLSWEFLSDQISSVGITLIEIPETDPSYTVNSTVTRFPSSGLQTALLSQVQEIIPLIRIQPRESGYPAIYVSDRRCTIGAQLYQARLIEFEGISQSIGNESDDAQFVFGNADRVMRDLVNDVDLFRASLSFSLFHVGTGIKLDLWMGEIIDWNFDGGSLFRVTAADGIYELGLPYPTRRISRTCWKRFDDALGCPYTSQSTGMDYTHFPEADPAVCDKGYDTASGCLAHGMKRYFGGVLAEPQTVKIKDKTTGTWGFGRTMMTSTSLVSESIYDQMIPEIYTDRDVLVNCKVAIGREESDFYDALGIVGEGPLTFGSGHKLDGQYHHGHPGQAGLREGLGTDPAQTGDHFALGEAGTAGSDWRKAESGGWVWKDNFAAGIAFLELRRSDEPGRQLTQIASHEMQAVVRTGLQGWVWTGTGARTQQTLTNPIWIVINVLLRALGLRYAVAATAEQYFDVTAAIAAAAICNDGIAPLVAHTETVWIPPAEDPENPPEIIPGHWETVDVTEEAQFQFRGTLSEEKPLRDWVAEILMNCLGYYSFCNGKIKLGIRINSSAVEAFTEGNILLGSLRLTAPKPAFNHLTVHFADQEFDGSLNSVLVYDIDHAKLIGGATSPLFLKAQMNLSGCSTKSQAARIAATRLREELGGITAAQWAAARELSFGTTVLALNVEPGMVCSMTHSDMPAGVLNGDPEPTYGEFRVGGWKLNRDYSIEIIGRTTVDEMYDLTDGPRPADVEAPALPIELYSMPPRATGGKASGGVGNATGNPTVTELLVQDDINPDLYHRKVLVEFTPPPVDYNNIFSRRTLTGFISQATTGGTVAGNQTLYVEVCPQADSLDGIPSDPLRIDIPVGTNTNKFTIQCRLPGEATHYVVRVGSKVGRLYGVASPVASPGSDWFEIEVTSLSGLDSASISPDPRYHHARISYYFDGSKNVRDAGATSAPEDEQFVFEPEIPENADTQIVVIVRSANADETDLFPSAQAPSATLTLTADSGNPSGASGLTVLTTEDDANIPAGSIVLQWARSTANYKGISAIDAWLSSALAAQGPYSAERSAHSGATIETGTLTVSPGSRVMTVTRSSDTAVLGRVLLIYTNDGSPDSDLERMVVTAQGANSLTISKAFSKSGSYTYAIVKRWWDLATASETTNTQYWSFPISAIGDVEQATWRTQPFACPAGDWYITVAERNRFGVGPRLYSAQFTVAAASGVPVDTVLPGAPVDLAVTTANGKFIGNWKDPATGNLALIDCVEQYDTVNTFNSANLVTFTFGTWLTHAEGVDPSKTYYFRVAARNNSGLASNATVHAAVDAISRDGSVGWGPFCATVGPITSVEVVPQDTVIPGVPTSISVTAPDGIGAGSFYGFWAKPATGNLTLDDCCEQYDTVNTFNSADLITFTFGQWLEFAQGFDPNKTYYFRFAAHNQSGIASDATTHAAVDSISRDGSVGWGPFSSAFGPVTSLAMPPSSLSGLARSQHGVFLETFEQMITTTDWSHDWANGTSSLEANAGQTGKNALKIADYAEGWTYKGHIPFDRTKLYRMRMIIKCTAHPDTANTYTYFGIRAYDQAYARIGASDGYTDFYFGMQSGSAYSFAHDAWYTITGYFKGTHGSTFPGAIETPLATAPGVLPNTTRYIAPFFGSLQNTPTVPGNIVLIDSISIDVMDEGAVVRSYLGINLNGTIAADMVIANSILANNVTAGKISVTTLAAISADLGSIVAGTITGGTIRTAASGARIELTSANGLVAYDSGNNITARFWIGGSLEAPVVSSNDDTFDLVPGGFYEDLTFRLGGTGVNILTTGNGDLNLRSQSGYISFGTHGAIGANTLTGYITIKDAAGNARKLGVVS